MSEEARWSRKQELARLFGEECGTAGAEPDDVEHGPTGVRGCGRLARLGRHASDGRLGGLPGVHVREHTAAIEVVAGTRYSNGTMPRARRAAM